VNGGHFAATTEPRRLGEILQAMEGYAGTLVVQSALRLAPLVFVRPGELRTAKWTDIDLDQAEWRYMVTKTKTPHIVPLSTQAVSILRELQPVTGAGTFVFPSARSNKRPMSDNAILVAMRTMEIGRDEMSGHGYAQWPERSWMRFWASDPISSSISSPMQSKIRTAEPTTERRI
jgi:integrase